MRHSSRLWLLVPVLAAAFLLAVHGARIRRVNFVTGLDQDAALGRPGRALIVPAHNGGSYRLIMQVQDMLRPDGTRESPAEPTRVSAGRVGESPAPVLWFLAVFARLDHALTNRPLDAAVEHAAIYAEPLLHGLILIASSALAAWQFGPLAAALVSLGLVALFPLAGGFVAGAPGRAPLMLACGLAGLLTLLAGFSRLAHEGTPPRGSRPRLWFVIAGMAGGFGMGIDPFSQGVLILGLLIGAGAGLVQPASTGPLQVQLRSLWRAWGGAGALILLAVGAAGYFSAEAGRAESARFCLAQAVAWVGSAELLARLNGRTPGERWRAREWGAVGIAIAAVALLPLVWWLADHSPLPRGRGDLRLTGLPDSAIAPNLAGWYREGGVQFWATFVPLLAVLPVMRRISVGAIDPLRRIFLTLVTGALGAMMLAASFYLKGWQQVDAVLLVLVVATTAHFGRETPSRAAPWGALGFLVLLLPGLVQLWPRRSAEIPVQEVNAMLEKDLARWLARRARSDPAPVVWAPPDTATALRYYGGLRGVGTFAPGDTEGLTAAVRLARAASGPEALALCQRRGVTHLVLPSWDPYFDDLVAAAGDAASGTFLGTLRAGELPAWLRPVPYQFRRVAGIEDYQVLVCEVVDEQEEIIALSRRAEYQAEMGQLVAAAAAAEALRRFPADVGALTARAQVLAATGDAAQRIQVTTALKKRLAANADRYLAWDRRASLAIVLAREQDGERAYAQARRCMTEVNPERLRSLNPGMLLNLQLLWRVFELPLPDPALATLGRELLPHELRQRL